MLLSKALKHSAQVDYLPGLRPLDAFAVNNRGNALGASSDRLSATKPGPLPSTMTAHQITKEASQP
jgi:hypothetical protein